MIHRKWRGDRRPPVTRYCHLAPGDLIYSGTPAGVGRVVECDVIHGEIDGLAPVDLSIGPAE